MKRYKNRLLTEFAAETSFELPVKPPASDRANLEPEFERLKHALLAEQLHLAKNPGSCAPLRRAANEAAALAWNLGFPLLLFPGLFEEKVATLTLHLQRQKRIHDLATEPFST